MEEPEDCQFTSLNCRVCSKEKAALLDINDEDRDNFLTITQLPLMYSSVQSNLICKSCQNKLKEVRQYRDQLYEHEVNLFCEEVVQKEEIIEIEPIEETLYEHDEEIVHPEPERPPIFNVKAKSRIEIQLKDLESTHDGKVICTYCGKAISRQNYRLHVERVHFAVKNFICDFCGREFYRKSSVRVHLHRHLDIRPYECKHKCGMFFHSKDAMSTHYAIRHQSEDLNFVCELCAKAFPRNFMLTEHKRSAHEEERFYCDYEDCNSSFNKLGALKKHQSEVHNPVPQPCDKCGQVFSSYSKLYNHRRTVHSNVEYACSYEGCDKKYPLAGMLNMHMRSHVGEECKVCGKMYKSKKNLRKHIHVFHMKQRFFCQIEGCNASLRNKDNYRNHVKSVHKNLPGDEMKSMLDEISVMKPVFMVDDDSGIYESLAYSRRKRYS